MNSLRYILSIISFLLSTWGYANKEIDSLLNVLDHDISNYSIYEKNKKERVENLKSTTVAPNSIDRYALNFSIYNEYKTYSSDSAFHYLYKNLALAKHLCRNVSRSQRYVIKDRPFHASFFSLREILYVLQTLVF